VIAGNPSGKKGKGTLKCEKGNNARFRKACHSAEFLNGNIGSGFFIETFADLGESTACCPGTTAGDVHYVLCIDNNSGRNCIHRTDNLIDGPGTRY
jgi:hypothetical protein